MNGGKKRRKMKEQRKQCIESVKGKKKLIKKGEEENETNERK